jgi:hypothetical protein
MKKSQFAKTIKIYKSHLLKNGFISVTYANVLSPSTVTTETTVQIEKSGGALNSLFVHLTQ